MEKNNNNTKSATELVEIIKDGLYGDKELCEIESRLENFEQSYAESVFELGVQPNDQQRIDLEFKAGEWTLNHLLGSEIHVATEIHGRDQYGTSLSYRIEPHQPFSVVEKDIN